MNNELYNGFEANRTKGTELRVGIIGIGNMGLALVNGFMNHESFQGSISVCNRTRDETVGKLNVGATTKNIEIAENNYSVVTSSDIIFISLKQAQMREELRGWRENGVDLEEKLIVSLAAGIRIGTIKKWLGNDKLAVVRVMPNTPAAIGKGVFGWTVSDEVTVGQTKQMKNLFLNLGYQFYVEEENAIDVVTSLSGSGPAYLCLLVEIMIQTAIDMGLKKDEAEEAGRQTFIGTAAYLAANPNLDLATLRRSITSRGGTTEAALQQFSELGLESIVRKAMNTAKDRAGKLADMFDDM